MTAECNALTPLFVIRCMESYIAKNIHPYRDRNEQIAGAVLLVFVFITIFILGTHIKPEVDRQTVDMSFVESV